MLVYMVIGVMLLIAAVNAVRALLISARVGTEAREDFAYRKKNAMIDPGVTEEAFIKAYRRSHGARGAIYGAATLFIAAALTPPMLALISISYEYLWRWNGQQRAFEPGYLVWQFILFGSVIAGWALIGHIGARFYYRNLPGSLETELAAQAGA